MTELLLDNIDIIIAVVLSVTITLLVTKALPYLYKHNNKKYKTIIKDTVDLLEVGESILKAFDKNPNKRNLLS